MIGAEQKSARNGLIDVMRLLYAGIVMMHHFYSSGEKHFFGGKFGVEFFVILSGFLFFSAWERKAAGGSREEQIAYWKSYIWKRYTRFFWYTAVAFVGAFLVVRVWRDGLHSVVAFQDRMSGDIWEILLVHMINGFNRGKSPLNAPTWNLGCMVFAEWLILGLCIYLKKPFLTLIMPCSILFGCGYWINMESAAVKLSLGWFTFGMLRIYLLTCIGIFCYWICGKLKELHFTKKGRLSLTVIELTGYLWCALVAVFRGSRYYQFCFIGVMTICLAVSLSGQSYSGRLFCQTKYTDLCAEGSLAIYLTHSIVCRWFQEIYPDLNEMYRQKFVFLGICLVAALAYMWFMRVLFKVIPRIKEKIKSELIEEAGAR